MIDLHEIFNRHEPEVKAAKEILRQRIHDRYEALKNISKLTDAFPGMLGESMDLSIFTQNRKLTDVLDALWKIRTRAEMRAFLNEHRWLHDPVHGQPDTEGEIAIGATLYDQEGFYTRSQNTI